MKRLAMVLSMLVATACSGGNPFGPSETIDLTGCYRTTMEITSQRTNGFGCFVYGGTGTILVRQTGNTFTAELLSGTGNQPAAEPEFKGEVEGRKVKYSLSYPFRITGSQCSLAGIRVGDRH